MDLLARLFYIETSREMYSSAREAVRFTFPAWLLASKIEAEYTTHSYSSKQLIQEFTARSLLPRSAWSFWVVRAHFS